MYMRRFNDVMTALLLLLLTLPVVLLSCLALWLEHPVFPVTRVERVTREGRVVWLYRLRTMRSTGFGPRPTAVGHFLHSLQIDYVPQLLNVLTGDLTLAGANPILDDAMGPKSLLAVREP